MKTLGTVRNDTVDPQRGDEAVDLVSLPRDGVRNPLMQEMLSRIAEA